MVCENSRIQTSFEMTLFYRLKCESCLNVIFAKNMKKEKHQRGDRQTS